jgi:RNA polymerase sigma-54 factor
MQALSVMVLTDTLSETPTGTLEVKAFLSVDLKQNVNSGTKSNASSRFQIRKLIEHEKSHAVTSDDAIVEALGRDGARLAYNIAPK